jgi:hypothetical protein
MVAGLLLQDCATLTAQEQVDGCNSDGTADIIFDPNQPVYATYVKIDGRSYIKTLRNKTRNKTKGEISIRLSTPIIQDGDAEKDMFVAEDHLGIRRIFFVSPKHVEKWCRAPPSVPGAWWKHMSQHNIPSTMVFKTDVGSQTPGVSFQANTNVGVQNSRHRRSAKGVPRLATSSFHYTLRH